MPLPNVHTFELAIMESPLLKPQSHMESRIWCPIRLLSLVMAQEGECNPSWANQSSSLKRYMWILRERISWHFEYCMPAYLYCLVSLPGLRLMKDMVYRRMCPGETEVRLLARLHYQKMTKLRTDCELDQAWTPAWKTNEASSLSGQGILSQGTSRTFQEADSDMR